MGIKRNIGAIKKELWTFWDISVSMQCVCKMLKEWGRDEEYCQDRPGCFFPSRGQRTEGDLDQQEIPTFLPHHVPPVDALSFSSRERVVVCAPYVFEKLLDASKRTKIGSFA